MIIFKKLFTIVILGLFCNIANAALVINGTRIIFSGNEKLVNIENTGKDTVLAQIWIESYKDPVTQVEIVNPEIPFVLTPQIFRVNPKEEQTVRVLTANNNLAKDRESLFVFSLLEIPTVSKEKTNANNIQIAINTKIKFIYRPVNVKSIDSLKDEEVRKQISIKLDKVGGKIVVNNTTANYISISDLKFINGNNYSSGPELKLVAPFTSETMLIDKNKKLINQADKLELIYVNDYGVKRSVLYSLKD